MSNCNNTDPQKLVRDGTSQDERPFRALDPAFAPVNEHAPAHSMVFVQAYSAYLRYFEVGDVPVDDWRRFFSNDVSVQLAMAAVQDVDFYRTSVKESFDFLNNRENDTDTAGISKHLGLLFAYAGSLAIRLDELKESLPAEIKLKASLKNRISSQLAPHFRRFLAYYINDSSFGLIADIAPDIQLFGWPAVTIGTVHARSFSKDWITDASADWPTFLAGITPENEYGAGTAFEMANRLSTHNLFTAFFDQLLKTYARVVNEAKQALQDTFTNWDSHEPHYTLFLAFLRLFEYARSEMNTLTGRHLDFYYKQILQLREKAAEPGHAHLLVELAKHAAVHELKAGTEFKAGKDTAGNDAFFAADRDFIANQAKVTALKTVYRHNDEKVNNASTNKGRLFASPVANSDDGLGAELLSVDKSWHPFYNKVYNDGTLQQINMPKAEIGFAVASHYLLLAEGQRIVVMWIDVSGYVGPINPGDVTCYFTAPKGWLEKAPQLFLAFPGGQQLLLWTAISGEDPSVVPYSAKTHGPGFDTELPIMKVMLKNAGSGVSPYSRYQDIAISRIKISVGAFGLKSVAVSNDFGPVDTSKPFQPFGASPVTGNSLVIGSKEVFQKKIDYAKVSLIWQNAPAPFGGAARNIQVSYLDAGQWSAGEGNFSINETGFLLNSISGHTAVDLPDFSENEQFSVGARRGFLKLLFNGDFGQTDYQTALLDFIAKVSGSSNPGNPPQGPFAESLSLDYTATQTISLNSSDAAQFSARKARFFHLAPFGNAERHPVLGGDVSLFPRFQHAGGGMIVRHEAEFYIGISGLKPPQNLALLFQVAEGTADPLSQKPVPHLHWSYLSHNNWTDFEKDAVEDLSGELTRSGIVTLAIPRGASDNNTLLPGGMHWIRIAVEKESDTVCRFILVAAQALRSTFADQGNDPGFTATPLEAGIISKLARPDSAVKKVEQPFPSFGGRGKEASADYYTRVSERLRHKGRAITLWDYERLVLEAFPQIYKVKCLNHTHYEPNESGTGIYRELAAGHVTVVTIPNQQFQNLRDPLRPYTSLGLLLEIDAFLRKRLSCFVKLHVKNPQFEEIRLDFRVRFYAGFDETYYTNQLRLEITRYLSPWAFPGGGSPSFGGKIFKSVLINFIEERPYVDYVTDFKLFLDIGGKKGTADMNEVEGSTAVSILVSTPEEKHTIIPITVAGLPATAQASGEDCSCKQ